jgi:hypothetical protein
MEAGIYLLPPMTQAKAPPADGQGEFLDTSRTGDILPRGDVPD